MSYRNSAKNRKLRVKFTLFLKILKFKTSVSPLSSKIILVASFISIASLFFPWIINTDGYIKYNSFSNLIGGIGYFIFLLDIVTIFLILSHSKKEKLKLNTYISFQDYKIINILSFLLVIFTFLSFNFIRGLLTFSENITFGNGIKISFTASIISIVGCYLFYKNYQKESAKIYIENGSKDNILDENSVIIKNNMKLPF